MDLFDPDSLRRSDRWRTGVRWFRATLAPGLMWLYRHLRGLYSVVGVYLIAGLGLATLAAWGFTALEVTALGNTLVIGVVVLVAAAFLWFTRHREAVFLLGAAVAGNAVLIQVLKQAFGQPRPRIVVWQAEYVGGHAFPSGHATTAMVVYATLAYLIVQLDPPTAARRFTVALAAAIVLLVGLSRLYLGVHYPTDVAAGFAVGFAWATLCAFGLEVFRYLRTGDDAGEPGAGSEPA